MPLNEHQTEFTSFRIGELAEAVTAKVATSRFTDDPGEPYSLVMPMELSISGHYVSERLLFVAQPERDVERPVTAIRYGHNGKVQVQDYDWALKDSVRKAFEDSGPGFGNSLLARPCMTLLSPELCPVPVKLQKTLQPLRAFSNLRLRPQPVVKLF